MTAPIKIRNDPHTTPFYLTAYGNVKVPAPRVAATRENIEPEIPPALNFL